MRRDFVSSTLISNFKRVVGENQAPERGGLKWSVYHEPWQSMFGETSCFVIETKIIFIVMQGS